MQLHLPSLDRLRQAQLRPEGIVTIFEHLAHLYNHFGAPSSMTTINWLNQGDELQEGDLIPTLTLSLQAYVPDTVSLLPAGTETEQAS